MSVNQGAGTRWQKILYLEPDEHGFESKILPLSYLEQICSHPVPQFTPLENGNISTSVAGLV